MEKEVTFVAAAGGGIQVGRKSDQDQRSGDATSIRTLSIVRVRGNNWTKLSCIPGIVIP